MASPEPVPAQALVTGAGGFVGSHLVEKLVRSGSRVRAFVRYSSSGGAGWLDGSTVRSDVEVVRGDIGDADSVERAMADVDVVYHLAALIGIPYSYDAPRSYVRTNIEGTLNVLRAATGRGALVVHTSTSEVYGTAIRTPIDEDHPLQAQSPYAATKIAADKLAESFHRSYGVRVVTVRPFNTYGPRQSPRAILPTIVIQALAGGKIRLGNLAATRDLTYVTDTVEGFERAGRTSAAIGRVINLGQGWDISIADLVKRVSDILGRELEVEIDPARARPAASEVDRLCASNQLAREILGWTPSIPFAEGLRRTIEWFKEHADGSVAHDYAV